MSKLKSLKDIPYGRSVIFINNSPVYINRRIPDSKFTGYGKGLNWKDGQPEPVYIDPPDGPNWKNGQPVITGRKNITYLDDSYLFKGITDEKSLKLYLDKLGIEGINASYIVNNCCK